MGSQSYNSCTKTMTAHANRRPHARTTDSSDSDDDHHKGICRTCADRSRRSNQRAPRTRREDPTTEARAATKAPLDAIIVAKQKSAPPRWPPQQTTRRRCRNPRGKDAAIHWSPGCGRLRDDAPKEEEDVEASSSPALAELRFPSEAKAAGRGEEHHTTTTLPRKSTTPTGVAVARSGRGRT